MDDEKDNLCCNSCQIEMSWIIAILKHIRNRKFNPKNKFNKKPTWNFQLPVTKILSCPCSIFAYLSCKSNMTSYFGWKYAILPAFIAKQGVFGIRQPLEQADPSSICTLKKTGLHQQCYDLDDIICILLAVICRPVEISQIEIDVGPTCPKICHREQLKKHTSCYWSNSECFKR